MVLVTVLLRETESIDVEIYYDRKINFKKLAHMIVEGC